MAFLLENLRLGIHPSDCANLAGVHEATLWRWMERGDLDIAAGKASEYARFCVEARRAAGEAIKASFVTIRGAMHGFPDSTGKPTQRRDWRAAQALAELANPARYGRRHVELTGAGGGPVTTAITVITGIQSSPEDISQGLIENGNGKA